MIGRKPDPTFGPTCLHANREPLPPFGTVGRTLCSHRVLTAGILLLASWAGSALAQGPPGAAGAVPTPARESAQVDLTGYWVSLITEDWLWRGITPARGDTTSVPLNPRGIEVANAWDLAADEANGEQCRPFGAAGLMRLPLRVHVTWADDDTLRIETDAGQQTRLFHFDATDRAGPERTWQGHSMAEWTRPVGRFDLREVFGMPRSQEEGPPKGSLKVVTQNLRSGYLRKNGLPYSENALLTEYYSRVSVYGNDYMAVLTVVHDPAYLTTDFVTSSHFKREPDGSRWNPSPCRTDPPRSAAEG